MGIIQTHIKVRKSIPQNEQRKPQGKNLEMEDLSSLLGIFRKNEDLLEQIEQILRHSALIRIQIQIQIQKLQTINDNKQLLFQKFKSEIIIKLIKANNNIKIKNQDEC